MRRAARLRGGGDGRVDEDLHSRQLCLMGHATLRSLARSTIPSSSAPDTGALGAFLHFGGKSGRCSS